jgi:predicted permease
MMPVLIPEYLYVLMFLLIILIVQLLKRRGIFNDSHQPVFDRLVIELALPAIVFASLASTPAHPEWIVPILLVIGAVLVCLVAGWAVCRLLRLPPAITGTVVLLSAFGSTYTFAAPLVGTVFGNQSAEMSFALVLDTFGIVIPFFTLGVLIAGYFGTHARGGDASPLSILETFLATPIFIAFILGLLFSLFLAGLSIPGVGIFTDVFADFFTVIRNSVDLLVWISIGLLIRPIRLRLFLPLLALVIGLQMVLFPALVALGAVATGIPVMERQVLVILAAMPAGAVAAVLASRYGCDGHLAAALVVCTYLASLVTIPVILLVMGGF